MTTSQHPEPQEKTEREGYVLVPREPTADMLAAGDEAMVDTVDTDNWLTHARNAYRAMIAASPSPGEAVAGAKEAWAVIAPFIKAAQFVKSWPADWPDDDFGTVDGAAALDEITIGQWRALAALTAPAPSPVGSEDKRRLDWLEMHVVEAVVALTRQEDEFYGAFIERVAKNPLAAEVKRADLRDNMDLSRLPNPGPSDQLRVQKYAQALEVLTSSPRQEGGEG